MLDYQTPQLRREGGVWCQQNPQVLLRYHEDGRTFLAIDPRYGVVHSADDEESFDAHLNDLRPSVLKRLFITNTALWVNWRGQEVGLA